jgi:uncharacterized membrane-anchored protein YjiN (DUF445 family)
MVGGLADWFAVTALFRHPLGLPIPHTAIIPENKDRIADTMAAFLRDNFLTPPVVARRHAAFNLAAPAAAILLADRGRRHRAARWARATCCADVLESLDHERLGGWSSRASVEAARTARTSRRCSASCSTAAIADRRHLPVIDA